MQGVMILSDDEFRDEAVAEDAAGEAEQNMKKGPWTAAEDAILEEYVNKYGEGNWNSVQKNCGLRRCGKSCRLRWANHLRPNLKKGAFSQEEEHIIVQLHAKLGNKWARMASLLPGRTDNEIKNFWNTRTKRRQRSGLPIYPAELEEEASVHHLHQNQQYHNALPPHQSSFSFSSLLSSPSNTPHNLNGHLYSSDDSDPTYDMGLPLLPTAVSLNGFNYSGGGKMTEISSTLSEAPPSSYSTGGGDFHGLMGGSTIGPGRVDYHEVAPLSPSTEENSGLLEAVLMESQALSRSDKRKRKCNDSSAGRKRFISKRKRIAEEKDKDINNEQLESDGKNNNNEKKTSSVRDNNDPMEMSSMDDDLFSLLNNFPSEMPVPEWYRRGEIQAVEVENQQNDSLGQPDQQFAWTLGTCSWSNNLPSIC
ncbi:hypothetical protein K1719_026825 [Acacia pycnantha]|nr:hypothetical protein K1719_026825 [Acacia pycnantha]